MDGHSWRRRKLSNSNQAPQPRANDTPKGKTCRFFAQGNCRYGSSCKFSHDQSVSNHLSSHRSSKDARAPTLNEGNDQEAFNTWRVTIRQNPGSYAQLSSRPIWRVAVVILDGESHQDKQQLVRDLVDDSYHGGKYLKATLETDLSLNDSQDRKFITNFLTVITHTTVLDCLSVETYTGTLYNMISGPNGERAVTFFRSLCRKIRQHVADGVNGHDVCEPARIFELVIVSLHELVRREKRASFHQDMPNLISRLDRVAQLLLGVANKLSVSFSLNIELLKTARRIFEITSGLIQGPFSSTDEPEHHDPNATLSRAYAVGLRVPGGRHDNDHLDMQTISLMPTASELLCDQEEYLPSTDFRQPHFLNDPVQRYLDTHFRLLRHDVFGSLKASLSPISASLDSQMSRPRSHSDLGVHIYHHAHINHISVDKKFGFETHVSFPLPREGRKKSSKEQWQWWENSKRLETGVLLCFLSPPDHGGGPLLLVAQKKGRKHSENQDASQAQRSQVQVTAKLAGLREADLLQTIRLYRKRIQGVLVEVPSLIPATVIPILGNLQKSQRLGHLPFSQYVVPSPSTSPPSTTPQGVTISPPQYARSAGFEFDLTCIATDKATLRMGSSSSPSNDALLQKLETRTSLDRGQCRALLCALTREFSLIQGPPGTGKSYLGVQLLQVLLASKRKANLGPIIVICYTNHALDQFLCHLLDVGIDKIVRIGGQSRSTRLDAYNLRSITSQMLKTKHENFLIGSTYSECEKQMLVAGKRLGTVHGMRKGLDWTAQKRALHLRFPQIYRQLYSDELEGYTVVGRDPMEAWLSPKKQDNARGPVSEDGTSKSIQEIVDQACLDIHSLTIGERRRFSEHVLEALEQSAAESIFVSLDAGESLRGTLNNAHEEVKRRALLGADVVGVTTTGLAKEAEMLRKLRSKVVICEEAGEVLEAHVISAMMPGIEHFIQIGDHQQLRPQINNYLLSLESNTGSPYQLDRSQFERLAVGQHGLSKIPVAQLNIQRRMRPEVSRLIQSIYPSLHDHDNVSALPDVVGMRRNVFWLEHCNSEDGTTENGRVKSHSNEWEVEMTKALARHLVRQGVYKGSDIAVLTPYSGQLQKLRTALDGEFEVSISDRDVEALAADGFEPDESDSAQATLQKSTLSDSLRLATVDNFQGEEAKVIIVSLVRSNNDGKVGFLRTENRINVLLSRAQHGLYLIGNSITYSKVPMWVNVQRLLAEMGSIGEFNRFMLPTTSSNLYAMLTAG